MVVSTDSNFENLITEVESLISELDSFTSNYNGNYNDINSNLTGILTGDWQDDVSSKLEEKIEDFSNKISDVDKDINNGSFQDMKYLAKDLITYLNQCTKFKNDIIYYKEKVKSAQEIVDSCVESTLPTEEPYNPYYTSPKQVLKWAQEDLEYSKKNFNETIDKCNEQLRKISSVKYVPSFQENNSNELYSPSSKFRRLFGSEVFDELENDRVMKIKINGETIYIKKSSNENYEGKYYVRNYTTNETIPFDEFYESVSNVESFGEITYWSRIPIKAIGTGDKVATYGEALDCGPVGY